MAAPKLIKEAVLVNLLAEKDVIARLDALAKEQGVSRSVLIRDAIIQYLKKWQQ